MVQALRLNTMSKLTFADSSRFDALVRDVFPGVDFKDVDYETLKSALLSVYEEARLEIIPSQVPVHAPYLGLYEICFIFFPQVPFLFLPHLVFSISIFLYSIFFLPVYIFCIAFFFPSM